MLGLLKKDLKSLALQGRVALVLVVTYGIIFFLGNNESGGGMVAGMIAMLSVLLPITALSYDEKARWDRYALTMPISRNMLVWSKYLLSLLIALVCGLLALGLMLLFNSLPFSEALMTGWVMAGVALFLSAITYPLYFKLGVEKARYVFMAIFLLPTISLLILNNLNIPMPDLDEAKLLRLLPLLPLFSLALFGLSGLLSCKIYAKKEF